MRPCGLLPDTSSPSCICHGVRVWAWAVETTAAKDDEGSDGRIVDAPFPEADALLEVKERGGSTGLAA